MRAAGSGLSVTADGDVAVVTMDRPEVLNAISADMRRCLLETCARLDEDDAVAAIVLTGAGQRAFSVGGDFNEIGGYGGAEAADLISEVGALYKRILGLRKPVVAALNGVAVGAGFQIAMVCDLRVAHRGVRLGQPEVNAGIPTALGPALMEDFVGRRRAMALTLSGRLFDAVEGEAMGFIDALVTPDQVVPQALALAREMAAKPRRAFAAQKTFFAADLGRRLDAAIAAGRGLMQQAYAAGEPQAIRAEAARRRAARTSGA